MTPAQRAATSFATRHGSAPTTVWSAPGRVNLIGEHTDYNDGFVLPFALPHRVAAAAATRADDQLLVSTVGRRSQPQHAKPIRIADLEPGAVTGWAAYVAGVVWSLREAGIAVGGMNLAVAGDVPSGAGLSSSAALECSVALAVLDAAGRPVDSTHGPSRAQVAKWAQRAENEFVGAPTGLLDQTASLRCTESHVLFFDVRSGETEQVPFDAVAEGLEVLVIDTGVNHAHSESAYADRRQGCEKAAELLGLSALRDIEPNGLDTALASLPPELRPLVRHVVTENQRVLDTTNHLRRGELLSIGALLDASHESMRVDYRISCTELDVAVEAATSAGALGARMTGGGFGGSAIALVPAAQRDAVERCVLDAFKDKGLRSPRLFTAVPSAGASKEDAITTAREDARS